MKPLKMRYVIRYISSTIYYICPWQNLKAHKAVERAQADVEEARARPEPGSRGTAKIKAAQTALRRARDRLKSFMPNRLDPHMDVIPYSVILCTMPPDQVFKGGNRLRLVVEEFCETKATEACLAGKINDLRSVKGKKRQGTRVPKSAIDRHDLLASDDDGLPDPV